MSQTKIGSIERVYTDEDGNEVREWGPEIPFDQFPPHTSRACIPNPDGPGYVWVLEGVAE